MSKKPLVIDGAGITGIASFYDEINRVFMSGEDWKIGASLDALNDMFYGGYGAIAGDEPVLLVWRNMDDSRRALGREATRAFLEDKLSHPDRYDVARIGRDLAELEGGGGQTFFEIVLEIIRDHPNIELIET